MKAKVIKTGEIIDAIMCMDEPELFLYKGTFHQKSDLEFLPDTSENVIEGWAAVDENDYFKDSVIIHLEKPYITYNETFESKVYMSSKETHVLPSELFPGLTFENSPRKVKITITQIE